MQHLLFDSSQNTESLIHQRPAIIKLPAAVIYIVAVVTMPRSAWLWYAAFAFALLITAALSRLHPISLVKRILLLEPFAIGIAVMALFQPDGWVVFLSMLTKSTLSISCMVILSQTTPFSSLINAMRIFRLPPLLITTLTLTYRYFFVLGEELNRMGRARRARRFSNSRWLEWRLISTIAAQLFIRSSERAERVYAAMCARGWKAQ